MANHTEVINRTITDIATTALDSVSALEKNIVSVVESGNTESARQQIISAYETYAASLAESVTPLQAVATDTVENQTDAGIGVGIDTTDENITSTLLADARGTVSETVRSHAETVSTIVIGAAVTGIATEVVANQARAAVSGVFMSTDDPVTTRLQNQLRRMRTQPDADVDEMRELVKQIKNRLPVDAVGGSLADQLIGAAENIVMKFDGAFTINRAKRYGIKRYEYAGGVVENTRPWCADLDGEILTEDEIVELWGESWQGKSGDNPWLDRGGYNCRHYWIPVEE